MSESEWRTYRPQHAPHVVGRYERRTFDQEAQMFRDQRIEMTCERCGATWQTTCATGQVRTHIMRFGTVHLHRDPLAAPVVRNPRKTSTAQGSE